MIKRTTLALCIAALTACSNTTEKDNTETAQDFGWQKLAELTAEEYGIGARPAGTKMEIAAADWIQKQWQDLGFDVARFEFDAILEKGVFPSSNLSITIPGKSDKILIIGGHYDSTGEEHGSLGAIDNGSGIAAMLDLSKRLKGQSFPYTVRMVAFGAEEHGLQGAYEYVNSAKEPLDKVVAMINLDTIIGGDKLYVHSANDNPYNCDKVKDVSYKSTPVIRDGLLAESQKLFGDNAHKLHPAAKGYPEGQTGGWSDHAPFACAGIPIAQLEATNFAIDGDSGKDGYSQTTHVDAWDCYQEEGKTACDRKAEKKWGRIWHTEFDRLDKLNAMFEGRLQSQLKQNVDVLEAYVLNMDKHFK